MNWFRNLNFHIKLVIPMVFIGVVMLVIAIIGITNIQALDKGADKIAYEYLPSISLLLNADRDMYQAQVAERSFIFLSVDSENYAAQKKQHSENIEQVKNELRNLKSLLLQKNKNL